jgi:uncharacterized DUF497 family protein
MARAVIEELEWDDENEQHLDRHRISPDDVYTLLERGDWIQRRNKPGHLSDRIQILGALGDGSLLNVVLESTATTGTWRPVTAWWATRAEASIFDKQKRNKHG